ncbi:uncharacterized protein BDV14DRAFT_205139 [Aspergillus stella-maris]|uniref:uncharacterized protein n=1 Tax=Aspergillus stella-maris TaxID=1810926 RepID=UPI003CCE1AFD
MQRITSNIDGLHHVLGIVRQHEQQHRRIPRQIAPHRQAGASGGNSNRRKYPFAGPGRANVGPCPKRPRLNNEATAPGQAPQTDVQPLLLVVTANRRGTMLPQPAGKGTSVIVSPHQLNLAAYRTPPKSTIKFHHIPGVNDPLPMMHYAGLAIDLDIAKSHIQIMSRRPPYTLETHGSIPFPSECFGARPYIRIDVMEQEYFVSIGGFFVGVARIYSTAEPDITHVSYETDGEEHAFGSQSLVQKISIDAANFRFSIVGAMPVLGWRY